MKKEGSVSFMYKVNEKVNPIAAKISGQRHIQAVTGGMMTVLPFTLIAAIFNIIKSPPVTAEIIASGSTYGKILSGWYNFATKYNGILSVPYNMTMGLISLIVVFGISYKLASSYKMKELSTAMISLVIFMMVAAPATPVYLAKAVTEGVDMTTLPTVNALNMTYLGTSGLFVAIVIGLLSTEVTRFCIEKKLVIKLPDAVPAMVGDSFSSMIPLGVNVVVFYGINLILSGLTSLTLPEAINAVITPAISNVNTPWAIILIIALGNLLWCFGIHGPALFSMLYIPLQFQIYAANSEIAAAGQTVAFQAIDMTQYSNCILGLDILLLFVVRSQQLKAVGKVSIIPGIFRIDEPLIFGAPIMYNPYLIIPMVGVPAVCMGLSYIAGSLGIITGGYNIVYASLPIGLNPFFATMNAANFVFALLMVVVAAVLWLPFIKMYDKSLLEQEKENLEAAE